MNILSLSGLRENGFSREKGFDESIFSITRINAIRTIIRTHLLPIKHVSLSNSAHSYSLKHLLERYAYATNDSVLSNYVSNGECIYAMFLEGYIIKPDSDGINAFFNVSKKSLDVLRDVVSRIDK